MAEGWRSWSHRSEEEHKRGAQARVLKARRLLHDAKTSPDDAEKTWTTEQSIRDTFQNNIDAETERYYEKLKDVILDPERIKGLDKGRQDRLDAFLLCALSYARHYEDMTETARKKTEILLQELNTFLYTRPVRAEVADRYGFLDPGKLREKLRDVSEERPQVLYQVVDTGRRLNILRRGQEIPAGWIAHDTLRDEPHYHEKGKEGFRFRIVGMKVVDQGGGFDSKLSALYITDKADKPYLRGKFGEGGKLSPLHFLRNGADIRMRSTYHLDRGGGGLYSRSWETVPRIEKGTMVARGGEIESEELAPTGSTTVISIRDAKEDFKKEFLDNVDPRIGGLAKNVAYYGAHGFVYPCPVWMANRANQTLKAPAGINIKGDGSIQYLQGLRVAIAPESFGYGKPWLSYDLQDRQVLSGRDRSELNQKIEWEIRSFWDNVDDQKLLEQLVHAAVHDHTRATDFESPELLALRGMLHSSISGSGKAKQKIIFEALVRELGLRKGQTTLIISAKEKGSPENTELLAYAKKLGYALRTIATHKLNLNSFIRDLGSAYNVITLEDVRIKMEPGLEKRRAEEAAAAEAARPRPKETERQRMKREEETMQRLEAQAAARQRQAEAEAKRKRVEGPKEEAIRVLFATAVSSVRAFAADAGLPKAEFQLTIELNDKVSEPWHFRLRTLLRKKPGPDPNLPPLRLSSHAGSVKVLIDPDDLPDPRKTDSAALQRRIELYLLAGYEVSGTPWKTLRGSSLCESVQNVVNFLALPNLIPASHPILVAIPQKIPYEKAPEAMDRAVKSVEDEKRAASEVRKREFERYRQALNVNLTAGEAQKLLKMLTAPTDGWIREVLQCRIFTEGNRITYYSEEKSQWETTKISGATAVGRWNDFPVYQLDPERLFIPLSLERGAALSRGSAKQREYWFSNGENTFIMNPQSFGFGFKFAHPGGVAIKFRRIPKEGENLQLSVDKAMEGFVYHPKSQPQNEGTIRLGTNGNETSLPITYGIDNWDDPVRVFEDIGQNHSDAAEGAYGMNMSFEVRRDGTLMRVTEDELLPDDETVGVSIGDNGSGYYPDKIMIKGVSSKKSPIYAGKYGEGMKMIAAAALRLGLDLTYESMVDTPQGQRAWSARAVTVETEVIKKGKPTTESIIAFDVAEAAPQQGSRTILRLPKDKPPTLEQLRVWKSWLKVVDPREQDQNGHRGLARYLRQLRKPGSERISAAGGITILLDEPGAIYENGLRLNAEAEGERPLAFGYDTPEVSKTRERNSPDMDRVRRYASFALAHTTDPELMEEVLREAADAEEGHVGSKLDVALQQILREKNQGLWAEVARSLWPHKLLFLREDAERIDSFQSHHIYKDDVLFVPAKNYEALAKLLPSVQEALKRRALISIDTSPDMRKVLGDLTAEGAAILGAVYDEQASSLSGKQLTAYPLKREKIRQLVKYWGTSVDIVRRKAVQLAAGEFFAGAAFRGDVSIRSNPKVAVIRYDEGSVLRGNRRNLAVTALHELAHIASDSTDYTEPFMATLYEIAKHLAKLKAQSKARPEVSKAA